MEQLFSFALGCALGIASVLIMLRLMRQPKVSRDRRSLYDELRAFFQTDPLRLPIISRSFMTVDLPNLHLAITEYAREKASRWQVVGYISPYGDEFIGQSLRAMIGQQGFSQEAVLVGPIRYREVDVDVDKTLRCVENGIFLLEAAEGKLAAHLRAQYYALELEVISESEEIGARFLEEVRERAWKRSVYRGKCISLECNAEEFGARGHVCIRFHRLPVIRKEDIVLPEETMTVIERNIVRFFRHMPILRGNGRPTKRGLLFYGKPGTGKTYTAKWLAQVLEGVTVLLLTGENLWLVKQCCQLARMLAPSLVIMEDADLIATERDGQRHPLYQVTLHHLLNELDGMAPDADVIFILTTNRPDVLEPALVARPGRIDQAIEFPLPDAEGRRQLLELYGRGLVWAVEDMDRLIARTEGASPAFIAELVRKASLFAVEENSLHEGTPRLTDRHFELALRELLLHGGELTRRLFGFKTDG